MLHPALYKLIGMQAKAGVRRMARGGASPARLLALLIGALLVSGWFYSAMISMRHPPDPLRVRTVMPLALLGICIITAVTSAGDKAIAFTPGEVDQLFPGPFTRRELLGYKLLKSTLMALITAGVLCVVMRKYAASWSASYLGVLMSLLFVQFFSIVLLLGGQAIGTAAYSRARRFVLFGGVLVLIVLSRNWMAAGIHGGEAAVARFRESMLGQIVLAPFDPFGQLMTARTFSQTAKWTLLAGLINLCLLVIVFMLDGYYVETAISASERRYEKIQRVRKGSFLSLGVAKTAQWHLPQLPFWAGAGPIAWRQLTNAARSSLGLLMLLLIVAVGAAPVLTMAGHDGKTAPLFGGLLGWLTFLCSSMLNFDFRGDIDHIENLKSLPLPGWAVVIGQMVAPVLLLTGFHDLLLVIGALTLHPYRDFFLAAIVVAPAFNIILFEAENLIFLLFPSRPAAVSPGDFQVLGRKFVFVIGKVLILAPACAVAAIVAVMAFEISGRNLVVTAIVAFFVLLLIAAGLVPLLAWAFRRYDPSIHTPA